jgi:flagellar basal-body rod protein FlgB
MSITSVGTEAVLEKGQSTNQLLKSYLDLVSFRHKVLSENIANLNTPGYKANEVGMPKKFADLVHAEVKHKKITLSTTSEKHLKGKSETQGSFASHKLKDPYEVKLNGNNVSIAQQMSKLSQNNTNYETALKAYQSGHNLMAAVHGK